MFILWLAILEKLATTDKPWLSHLGHCVLCNDDMVESHDHLFFHWRFSRRCICTIRCMVRFQWRNREWTQDIVWGARKWRGKHIINIAYRALLGSCVYHIWKERNTRRFEQVENPPSMVANLIMEDMRQRIISLELPSSVSTRALYRLWRIPWPVEGDTWRGALLYHFFPLLIKITFYQKNHAKQLIFERSQNSTKLDPNVGLDPSICIVNVLNSSNNYKLV